MPAIGHEAPLLQMRGVRKAFGAVEVLHGVDFDLRRGEVHALVGENGAGKSTLIKILAGVYPDYQGQVLLGGREVRLSDPRAAERHGIAVIHQELALIPYLSAAENMFLAHEPTSWWGGLRPAEMRQAADQLLRSRLGVELDVSRPVADLPVGAQQLVEIAKALSRRAEIIVMDEPTSALSEIETRRLFQVIGQLRDSGVGVIYISHKMDEIYALADRITVLRDGQYVGTAPAGELPEGQLVQWMVGRSIDPRGSFDDAHSGGWGLPRLHVSGLWLRDPASGRWVVQDVSLHVRAGEIVGLAGLLGSGASALLGAIFGRYGPPTRGQVSVDGRRLARFSPRQALRSGLALLTNDRKASGLVAPMSVLHNLSLAVLRQCRRGGLLSTRCERQLCAPFAQRVGLRGPGLGAEVASLSGGSQQKVLLARWLLTGPKVLLLDEPTRGIDVGAKADVYKLLRELAAGGLAILMIASELTELLRLADRILVLHRGRIVAELPRQQATQERIIHAAMGS